MTAREAAAFERQRGTTLQALTSADVKKWGDRWCCRWCRAKAMTIAEIEHAADCSLVRYCRIRKGECG